MEYRDIMFNSVSQYPKDHQDPRIVLENLEIKAFMVYGKVLRQRRRNKQTVSGMWENKMPLEPLEPKCLVGRTGVGMQRYCT